MKKILAAVCTSEAGCGEMRFDCGDRSFGSDSPRLVKLQVPTAASLDDPGQRTLLKETLYCRRSMCSRDVTAGRADRKHHQYPSEQSEQKVEQASKQAEYMRCT